MQDEAADHGSKLGPSEVVDVGEIGLGLEKDGVGFVSLLRGVAHCEGVGDSRGLVGCYAIECYISHSILRSLSSRKWEM